MIVFWYGWFQKHEGELLVALDGMLQNALSQLCKLYAVHGIVENMGEFMQV
jgi:hypothetical protein